jgi:hypothetical protein
MLYIYVATHQPIQFDPEDGDSIYVCEASATYPTTTRCNNPRTELTKVTKHCESLKSVIIALCIIGDNASLRPTNGTV